jgi:hypothetical protein
MKPKKLIRMKEHPILFSTPMVRALFERRKSQTRRVKGLDYINEYPGRWILAGNSLSHPNIPRIAKKYDNSVYWCWDSCSGETISFVTTCPYGKVGDTLWVRETWNWEGDTSYEDLLPIGSFWYKADFEKNEGPAKWKPSIFMPRKACRILLEVTDIRTERIQNISEEDAINEGIEHEGDGFKCYAKIDSGRHKGEDHPWNVIPNRSAKTSYQELWESLNGINSWANNPWVWVIEFKRID